MRFVYNTRGILRCIFSFKNEISSRLSGNESNINDVIPDAREPPLSPQQQQPLAMATPARDEPPCSHSVLSSSSSLRPSGSCPNQLITKCM